MGREGARPQTPLTDAPGAPPWGRLCCPASTQRKRATPCAVGLVMGSHTRIPGAHRKRAVGRGITPQGRAIQVGRVPNLEHASQRHEAPPWSTLVPPPYRARPARKSVRFGIGDRPSTPHSLHPRKKEQPAPGASPDERRLGEGQCPTPEGSPRPHGPSPVGADDPEPGRETPGPGQAPPHTTRHRAKCARHANKVGGAHTAEARAHTRTTGTANAAEDQPGQTHGTHRPRRMTYQQARARDSRTGNPQHARRGALGKRGGRGGGSKNRQRLRPP